MAPCGACGTSRTNETFALTSKTGSYVKTVSSETEARAWAARNGGTYKKQ